MRKTLCAVVAGVTVMAAVACTGPKDPTREEAAAYFGLAAGRKLTFDVTVGAVTTTATMEYSPNSSFADRLAFSQEERNAGNIIVDTLVWAAEIEELRLLRRGDCLPNCTDYLTPPLILTKPLQPNATYESEVRTSVSDASGRNEGPQERHQVTVGAEVALPTGAGTFKAYPVTWRRFVSGNSTSVDVQFYFAPDRGIVQWQKNGNTYVLNSGVSP